MNNNITTVVEKLETVSGFTHTRVQTRVQKPLVAANQLPKKKRQQRRRRTTIWSLPEELLLNLFDGLDVKDLLSIRSTHPSFMSLIDNNSSVWKTCTFRDIWPSQLNSKHFEKAAKHHNFEALIKLGVAYLYNVGLQQVDVYGAHIAENGKKAGEMFCHVEEYSASPFTYIFICPPWSTDHCSKVYAFNQMTQHVKQNVAPNVEICIVNALQLLETSEGRQREILDHLETASNNGSNLAKYLTWKHKYQFNDTWKVKQCIELQAVRELRSNTSLNAKLTLCRLYALGMYGGVSKQQATIYMRNVITDSTAVDISNVCTETVITDSMRYILVDWMAEIASDKGFDSLTLHLSINIVDRFLKKHTVTYGKFQLLGISAMVICSKFLGGDIIVIREATYFTANTYTYDDIVMMIGEISAVLRGNFRMPITIDYTSILGLVANNDRRTELLAEYFCELSLLHSELSKYKQATLAAAAQLLARLTLRKDNPWTCELHDVTGLTVTDFTRCAIHLHKKIFEPKFDYCKGLHAITSRYSNDQMLNVATLPMLTDYQLLTILACIL